MTEPEKKSSIIQYNNTVHPSISLLLTSAVVLAKSQKYFSYFDILSYFSKKFEFSGIIIYLILLIIWTGME
jgi:hypothetical protein